jgi:hypothetical protein
MAKNLRKKTWSSIGLHAEMRKMSDWAAGAGGGGVKGGKSFSYLPFIQTPPTD